MTDCTCERADARAGAVAALNGQIAHGLRPRDWDGLSVSRLEAAADGCLASVEANLLLYYRCLDTGRPALAAAHLNRLLDVGGRVPPAFQTELALTAAYFAARHVRDAEAARGWLEQAPVDGANAALRAQAEAAVLVAEGHFAAARDAAETGLMNLRADLLGGLSSVQADALRELLDQAAAALPAPPAPAPAAFIPQSAFAREPAEPAVRVMPETPAAADDLAAGPTLGLGLAIALVIAVTLAIAVMPLPRGGSSRLVGPPTGPLFTQTDSSENPNAIQFSICRDGCPLQSTR